ncbi:MAG: hypothetical protein QF815_02380 [Candidatus Peribacteraceae bacterium]|nr:hypothetical protein [Candidatus Peribacteraceae bacterium]MDP7477152.1 hypothetical protein [Candidatus Peribacteraceae bacterium]
MISYLQKLSGFLFYVLGGSFFLAYMLQYNEVTPWAAWWLKTADLPLALVGMLFGGSSLYLSVKPRGSESRPLFMIIGIPLVVIFSTLLVMNFWTVLT